MAKKQKKLLIIDKVYYTNGYLIDVLVRIIVFDINLFSIGKSSGIFPFSNIDSNLINSIKNKNTLQNFLLIEAVSMDDEGNNFVIEMQNKVHPYFRERMVFYTSKVIGKLKKRKEKNYYDIKGTYVIAFINDDMARYDNDDDFCQPIIHYHCVNSVTGNILRSAPEYFFVQLRKDAENLQKLSENEKKWLSLLRESKFMTEVPVAYADNPAIQAYFEASRYMNLSSTEQIQYAQIMDNKYDIALHEEMICNKAKEEGRDEGRAEGELNASITIAKNLIENGLDIEFVAKNTGLSVDELNNLIK